MRSTVSSLNWSPSWTQNRACTQVIRLPGTGFIPDFFTVRFLLRLLSSGQPVPQEALSCCLLSNLIVFKELLQVGMAATLAGVCQVPLTAVLLLFQLTQDYRILLPLLGAVGVSSLIASSQNRKKARGSRVDSVNVNTANDRQTRLSFNAQSFANSAASGKEPCSDDLCDLESSLCLYEFETRHLADKLTVSQAMRTTYATVLMKMSLMEAVNLMLSKKQSCAVVVEEDNYLVGLLSLEDISRAARIWGQPAEAEKLLVSDICYLEGNKCHVQAATPNMTLLSAENIMNLNGVSQLPVVSEYIGTNIGGHVVGLLDRECIEVSCWAHAAKELLSLYDDAA